MPYSLYRVMVSGLLAFGWFCSVILNTPVPAPMGIATIIILGYNAYVAATELKEMWDKNDRPNQ